MLLLSQAHTLSGTNGAILYLEGKLQLKHFYKKQGIKHILCSQSNNGAAFVPDSETSLAKAGKIQTAFLVGFKMATC